jgi:hypothetical protein
MIEMTLAEIKALAEGFSQMVGPNSGKGQRRPE